MTYWDNKEFLQVKPLNNAIFLYSLFGETHQLDASLYSQ